MKHIVLMALSLGFIAVPAQEPTEDGGSVRSQ